MTQPTFTFSRLVGRLGLGKEFLYESASVITQYSRILLKHFKVVYIGELYNYGGWGEGWLNYSNSGARRRIRSDGVRNGGKNEEGRQVISQPIRSSCLLEIY